MHNISTFMSIQYCNEPSIPCTTSQPSCLFKTTTNHQYRAQRLNVHVYSVLQRTVNTVHNVSTIMSIQNSNELSIPYTASQRSCLFRTTTNRQYCAQCLNVHAYSEREWFNYMYISTIQKWKDNGRTAGQWILTATGKVWTLKRQLLSTT